MKEHLIDNTNDNLFKSTENNGAIFDVDNIMEVIDSLDRTNYSFHFKFDDTPDGTFYNLIVGRTPEGELGKPYVVRFVCDQEYLSNFVLNNFDFNYFKGKVYKHKYTDYFEPGSIIKSTPCETEYDQNGDPVACGDTSVDVARIQVEIQLIQEILEPVTALQMVEEVKLVKKYLHQIVIGTGIKNRCHHAPIQMT